MNHKNPFRGIACSNGSNYGLRYFRHIEGARDIRRSYRHRTFWLNQPFRDDVGTGVPVSFTE